MSVEVDDEKLILVAAFDRATDALGRMIASGDANGLARRIGDRDDLAVLVEFMQVTIGTAGAHPTTRLDAAAGHLHQVHRIGGPAETNDRPLIANLVGVASPQNLSGAVGFGLQRLAAGLADVGETMPSLGDVDSRRDDAIEHNSADRVCRDRFDGDADAAGVIVFRRRDRLNGRVANEAGQFDRAGVGVGQRRVEPNDAADRNDVRRGVVNANGRRVADVRALSAATGQPIAMHRFGGGDQSVVIGSGDRQAGRRVGRVLANQVTPKTAKFPSG